MIRITHSFDDKRTLRLDPSKIIGFDVFPGYSAGAGCGQITIYTEGGEIEIDFPTWSSRKSAKDKLTTAITLEHTNE